MKILTEDRQRTKVDRVIGILIAHLKVSKCAKIRSRYNQLPHPTQDTNGKVTNSQLDTTNESQEVSPFKAFGSDELKLQNMHGW